MPIKRGHLYIVNFNPRIKTKPGKLRPALVLQSDLVTVAELMGQPGSTRSHLYLPTKADRERACVALLTGG